jgi:hypothetical protein
VQKQVASVNTTVTGKLLADLGIAYNFSDSGIDSSENGASIEADMGDDTFTAALTVDFVQRFNFSATEGGAITFRSPQAKAEGYASILVFDEAGAVMFPRAPLFPRPSRCLSSISLLQVHRQFSPSRSSTMSRYRQIPFSYVRRAKRSA